MGRSLRKPKARKKAVWGRSGASARITGLALALLLLAAPVAAQNHSAKVDEAVRKAVVAGQTTRVIMQFATAAKRDTAFDRLLDRGAAVRTMDTEGGAALNVVSSAAAVSAEFDHATQASVDARIYESGAQKTPARARATKAATARKNSAKHYGALSVAVIDSGLQVQADLPEWRVRKYVDFRKAGGP